MIQELPMYTEYLDRNSSHDLQSTEEEMLWRLARDKMPYHNSRFDNVYISSLTFLKETHR